MDSRRRRPWSFRLNNSNVALSANSTRSQRCSSGNWLVVENRSGLPFRVQDLLNIVQPDSEKESDDTVQVKIGKFGTGLTSTGIISLQMRVMREMPSSWMFEYIAKSNCKYYGEEQVFC